LTAKGGSARASPPIGRAPARPGWTIVVGISGLMLLASCGRFDRANRARLDEIRKLSHETFAQAAERDRCLYDSCAEQEAGFAYAKKNRLENSDGCLGKGDGDFVEGCKQYGEDISDAYHRIVPEG